MGKIKTQADQRRDFNATDQFGRLWLVAIEVSTGDPCGQVDVAGWSDPLNTPQKYIRVSNAFGIRAGNQSPVHVDFEAWVRDQQDAEAEWKRSYYSIGQKVYQNKFNPKDFEDEYLLSLAGPKPWPSAEALLRARAGHRKLLGLEPLDRATRKLLNMETIDDLEAGLGAIGSGNDEVAVDAAAGNEDAPTNPPETWPQFLKRVVASGEAKNTQEAAALWNAAKARR